MEYSCIHMYLSESVQEDPQHSTRTVTVTYPVLSGKTLDSAIEFPWEKDYGDGSDN